MPTSPSMPGPADPDCSSLPPFRRWIPTIAIGIAAGALWLIAFDWAVHHDFSDSLAAVMLTLAATTTCAALASGCVTWFSHRLSVEHRAMQQVVREAIDQAGWTGYTAGAHDSAADARSGDVRPLHQSRRPKPS